MEQKETNSSLETSLEETEFEVEAKTSILAKISFSSGLFLIPATLGQYFYFYYDLPSLFDTLMEIGFFLCIAMIPAAFFFGLFATIRIIFSNQTRTGYGLSLFGIIFSIISAFAIFCFFMDNFTIPT